MFWTIGQFPELDHLDPIQRAAALKRVPWHFYPQLIVGCIFGGLIAGIFVAIPFFVWFGQMTALCVMSVAGLLIGAVAYSGSLKRIRAVIRSEIAKAFEGKRAPFCFSCGYDLRGSADGLCPECGRRESMGVQRQKLSPPASFALHDKANIAEPTDAELKLPAMRSQSLLWSVGQFPELDHLSAEQRVEVLRTLPWHFYPILIIKSMLGAFSWGLVSTLFLALFGQERAMVAAIFPAVAGGLWSYLAFLKRIRATIRREVAKAFIGQRPPFCYSCGYDFHELKSNTCPECGHSIS